MKKFVPVVLALALAAMLAACAHTQNSPLTTRQNLVTLTPGMTMAEVEGVLGAPIFKDIYVKGKVNRTTLYYYTNENGDTGLFGATPQINISRLDCTPVVFKDDKLFMTGRYNRLYY